MSDKLEMYDLILVPMVSAHPTQRYAIAVILRTTTSQAGRELCYTWIKAPDATVLKNIPIYANKAIKIGNIRSLVED